MRLRLNQNEPTLLALRKIRKKVHACLGSTGSAELARELLKLERHENLSIDEFVNVLDRLDLAEVPMEERRKLGAMLADPTTQKIAQKDLCNAVSGGPASRDPFNQLHADEHSMQKLQYDLKSPASKRRFV